MYPHDPQIADFDDVLNYLFATNKNITQVMAELETNNAPMGVDENAEFDLWEELQMEDNQ